MKLSTTDLTSAEQTIRAQLRPVVERALAGAMLDVLGEPTTIAALPTNPTEQPNGPPASPVVASGAPAPAVTPRPSGRRRKPAPQPGKRVRRSPEELKTLADKFVAYVAAHPGSYAGALAQHLEVPIGKLRTVQAIVRDDGRVETSGTKVHTQYWPAGKVPKAARATA